MLKEMANKPKKAKIILTKEAEYFDNAASTVDINKIDISNAFNKNSREGQFILKQLPKNLRGKVILDIGCGLGESTVFLAKRGGKVTGIDISSKALNVGRKLAKLHKVSRLTNFKIGDIQKLPDKSASIDIVIGKAVLHHVDLKKAITEVERVLKPGGIAIFSDPFDYNPIVKLYDKFASDGLRSPGERRLNLKDLKVIKGVFKQVEWIGTDITPLFLFLYYFTYLKVTRKVSVNWFENIQNGYQFVKAYSFFNRIDNFFPKIIQVLGWRIVILCRK